MHITKNDVPVKIDAPGAIARQQTDFGAAFGVMGAEFFTMAKGGLMFEASIGGQKFSYKPK